MPPLGFGTAGYASLDMSADPDCVPRPPAIDSNSPATIQHPNPFAPPMFVTGVNLQGVTSVTVGGSPISFTPINSTRLWFPAPSLAAGMHDVVVTTPQGSATAALLADRSIEVTGASTFAFAPAGGTLVTVTGVGFTGVTGVQVKHVDATSVSVAGDTSMSFVVPAGMNGAATLVFRKPLPGTPDVETRTVTGVGGSTFEYVRPLTVVTTRLPNRVVGVPYSATVVATGGTGTFGYGAFDLPPGLSLPNSPTDPTVGLITGTQTAVGTSTAG